MLVFLVHGYLEWTGDNLILSSSQNMFVKRNEHGQIEYYYQKIGDDDENIRFEEVRNHRVEK